MATNPTPDTHLEVLYRGTFNTYGQITALGLTQDNRVGNDQKVNNARLTSKTNKGILAGSVVAVAGDGLIGPAIGDGTSVSDKVVGIAINDALGNAYESSSAIASNRVVYLHGSQSVVRTDIYESKATNGTSDITYLAGQKLYSSRNGLLTTPAGMDNGDATNPYITEIAIILKAPSGTDPYMVAQLKI